MTNRLKIYTNNNYCCFMILPNINIWYEDHSLFFGWLLWGFNIELKKMKNYKAENNDRANKTETKGDDEVLHHLS